VAAGNTTYWSSNGTTDVISSALSYIPEIVWNDSAAGNLSSGGGGISTFTARPSWQTGITGITSGTMRLVPDISLSGSPDNAGYLYCSSDSSTKVTGSCTNGFRDANNTNLTVAGGTSFGPPIFAGLMSIINQKTGSAQGVANTRLYSLAANSSTYASAFHDITSGNNNCSLAGTTLCPSTSPAFSQYSAGTGYDLATGLGSMDFNNLLTAWSSSSTGTKSFTVAATNATVAAGSTGTSTVAITPQNGYTGTINWAVSSSPSSSDLCFSMPSTAVSGTTAVTANLTIKTSASACGTAAIFDSTGKQMLAGLVPGTTKRGGWRGSFLGFAQTGLAFAAILLIGMGRQRARAFRVVGCSLILTAAGLVNAGCSSSSSSGSSGNAPKGTYTVTVTGTDSATSSITAPTTMTLTID
jgi:hypothetical protein